MELIKKFIFDNNSEVLLIRENGMYMVVEMYQDEEESCSIPFDKLEDAEREFDGVLDLYYNIKK